jgi:hypothetical protein
LGWLLGSIQEGLLKQLGIFAFAACLAAVVPAKATPVDWFLQSVTFDDGGTASGSFTYDAALDGYSNWNITVTPGTLTAYNYLPAVDGGFEGVHSASAVDFVASPDGLGRYVRLTFVDPLTDAGGTCFSVQTIPDTNATIAALFAS